MVDILPEEVAKLKAFLESKFKNTGFALQMREKAKDSVEVMLNGEFIGVIYKLVDEGETSYDMNVSILDIDLDEF